MEFDDYQRRAKKYDQFDDTSNPKEVGLIEKVLGLPGEAGEVADKFKKILRDKDGEIGESEKEEIKKELGDVLWYLAAVSRDLGILLSEVAEGNLEKLESRYQRGKLGGSGDNR